MDLQNVKYLVVGAGFWGAVLAERIATTLRERVVVIDRRRHIGGNSDSHLDATTGIECHSYGTHIFHTNDEKVWSYITRFGEFTRYQHKVLTTYQGRVYNMPISLSTINSFYNTNLKPNEVASFMERERERERECEQAGDVANLETKAISLIGRPLYEALIKGYTIKQWNKDPSKLPPEIITRLPVRDNYDNSYFSDYYQGLPRDGYHALFEKILKPPLIELHLNCDYYAIKDRIPRSTKIYFSGPIDKFLNFKFGKLKWRGLRFESEVVALKDYQGTSVMNYGDLSTPYTRIHEFKHLHPERKEIFLQKASVICKEYSVDCDDGDNAYYPINDQENDALWDRYHQEVSSNPAFRNITFGGRLGGYRYLNMDQTIATALTLSL
ncbi:MAG: UDP-galactopyranose mutase [Oligoflexia bacterium]|nr:UDP-galactopyranose mutase [Oligoflexia bacterium]MBF0367446.1 UDP-galactopyranose mutase [Oligoflexia bacterium]